MSRVLIITTEPLPLEGWPTTGAGLRAWALAHGLKSRGHEVRLLMPKNALAGFKPPVGSTPPTRDLPDWIGTFARDELADDPRPRECDVVVLQHWGLARRLGEVQPPLAIDLAGPHLLERRLWGSRRLESDLTEKLDALRRADFITVSGERQRHYFLAFLAMAGWEISAAMDLAPVIPFSLDPSPVAAPTRADRFIYAGFFLPWQDPARAIEATLDELESAGRGELVFIGGPHPHTDVSLGKFEALAAKLKDHPRVRSFGPMSYNDFLSHLDEGGIALDLMARNAERELAFTTRTVQFLARGLPVIHNNYSELGQRIEERGAGWTFDPEDADGLRTLIGSLLGGDADPQQRAEAAHRMAAEELHWEATIDPLDGFCRDPRYRPEKIGARLAFEEKIRKLETIESEMVGLRKEHNTLRGKRWVRLGLRLFSWRAWAAAPLALTATILGLVLIPVFWINDRLGKH